MHTFETSPQNITPALRMAMAATSPKSPLPVLQGMLFEIYPKQGLTVTGGDLEQFISVKVPHIKPLGGGGDKEKEPQAIRFVAPKKVIDAIQGLPQDSITNFSLVKSPGSEKLNILRIKYGPGQKWEQKHNILSAGDYPALPKVALDASNVINIPLKNNFSRVTFATSKEITRPVFTGLHFNLATNKVETTDTFRAAMINLGMESQKENKESQVGSPGGVESLILQRKTVELAAKLENPVLAIEPGNRYVKITGGDVTIISQVIPGRYPPVAQVMPVRENCKLVVELAPDDMLETVRRATLLLDSRNHVIKFIFMPQDGLINVRVQSAEGDVNEDVPCNVLRSPSGGSGEKTELVSHFNHTYLTEALKAAGTEAVTWYLTGPYTPSLIEANGDESEWCSVVVPVRPVENK